LSRITLIEVTINQVTGRYTYLLPLCKLKHKPQYIQRGGRISQGANKPGGEKAGGRTSQGKSQGANQSRANEPGGERARGEPAKGRKSHNSCG